MTASLDVGGDLKRAEALIEVNRVPDAARILSGVIAAAPDNVTAYCLMARCHSITGDFAAMLDAANRAIAAGPAQEWGYRLRSMALRSLGHPGEAVVAARTAIRLAPMLWQPYINLVEALLKYPDRESRRQAYQAALQAIKIAPEVAGTHTTLGRVYMSIGERDAARRCFERAIGISPTDAAATTNLAILDLHGGRLNRAGHGLRSVAAANPGVAKHAYNVRVAATHWVMRALDFGTLAWLGELALDLYVRRPLGGVLALVVSAVYIAATGLLYARLPKPMRRLVVEHLMGRHRVVSALFVGLFGYFIWASAVAAMQNSPGEGVSTRDIAFFAIALLVRLPSRVRSFAEPYLLRRRYRAYVLGDAPTPAIPRQRTDS